MVRNHMKPTMNPPDTKCVLIRAIFVAAFCTLCVVTCPKDHFQVQESLCCLNCEEGMYVVQNCSRGPTEYTGAVCQPCRICEELGEITVSQCMQFSDTRCARKVQPLTLYVFTSVIAAVFMMAVILTACFFWRICKSDESSAGEPLHISI